MNITWWLLYAKSGSSTAVLGPSSLLTYLLQAKAACTCAKFPYMYPKYYALSRPRRYPSFGESQLFEQDTLTFVHLTFKCYPWQALYPSHDAQVRQPQIKYSCIIANVRPKASGPEHWTPAHVLHEVIYNVHL